MLMKIVYELVIHLDSDVPVDNGLLWYSCKILLPYTFTPDYA